MPLLRRLERKLGPYAIPNVTLGLVILQAVVFLFAMSDRTILERLVLVPAWVLEGEVWRLLTFLAIPPTTNPLFALLFWYLFYLMGTALEQTWGAFRYNLYLLLGYLANVGAAFLVPEIAASNIFLQATVFLAFAYLNPDFQLYIFFVLPVKVKWLAWLAWALYLMTMITGSWSDRLLTIASVFNFFVFFGKDIVQWLQNKQRRAAWEARQTPARGGRKPFHRCEVCGITDISHPDMTFRYCSQCEGARCYCADHIRNHQHLTSDKLTEERHE